MLWFRGSTQEEKNAQHDRLDIFNEKPITVILRP